MRLFKKLSLGDPDDNDGIASKGAKKFNFFSWFTKSTEYTASAEHDCKYGLALSELVPKAKISASSSQQVSSSVQQHKESNTFSRDDFCCGVISKSHSLLEHADKDDESIKSFQRKKFTPNKDQHETLSRRSSRLYDDRKNFYICYEPAIDYGRLEVPDSIFPSVMNWPSNYGDIVDMSEKTNYKVLSNIEHNLDQSKYNILNCMLFNHDYQHEYQSLGSGCRPAYKVEDFDDDNNSTPMDLDTKNIKLFYRLSELDDILLHYNDIAIEASYSVGRMEGFLGLMSWLVFKGKEIKEKHKEKHKVSWLRNIASKLLGSSKY